VDFCRNPRNRVASRVLCVAPLCPPSPQSIGNTKPLCTRAQPCGAAQQPLAVATHVRGTGGPSVQRQPAVVARRTVSPGPARPGHAVQDGSGERCGRALACEVRDGRSGEAGWGAHHALVTCQEQCHALSHCQRPDPQSNLFGDGQFAYRRRSIQQKQSHDASSYTKPPGGRHRTMRCAWFAGVLVRRHHRSRPWGG
jgi:hypothetical protein